MWSYSGNQPERNVLHGIQNSKAREACIRQKVKIFCSINSADIEIYKHYVITLSRMTLWFRTQDYIAKEIYRVEPRIRSQDFKEDVCS